MSFQASLVGQDSSAARMKFCVLSLREEERRTGTQSLCWQSGVVAGWRDDARGENVLGSQEPALWDPAGQGWGWGRFVILPCAGAKRSLTQAASRKVLLGPRKCWFSGSLQLYLEMTFPFPQINSSLWKQCRELCWGSEEAGLCFSLFHS